MTWRLSTRSGCVTFCRVTFLADNLAAATRHAEAFADRVRAESYVLEQVAS